MAAANIKSRDEQRARSKENRHKNFQAGSTAYLRGRRNNSNNAQPKAIAAKGANDTLNELGCLFGCIGAKQAEQFETFVKVLAMWVGASWEGGSDVSRCLLSPRFIKPDILIPPFPENLEQGCFQLHRNFNST